MYGDVYISMYICIYEYRDLQRPERSVGSLGTGGTEGHELTNVLGPNSSKRIVYDFNP